MTQFGSVPGGAGYECATGENAGAEAGAKAQVDKVVAALSGAEVVFAEGAGVGVFLHPDGQGDGQTGAGSSATLVSPPAAAPAVPGLPWPACRSVASGPPPKSW